jgi:DNA invertase Pin-like site-specific DNA recombinase
MNVGYARVSTGLQNLNLQMDALTKHGCVEIFKDKLSGAKEKRIGLEEALRFIREGDTLVVWRLDRLGKNMQHLIQLVNATGQLMFHLFAAFAEFERNLIQERSAAGRVAARARGRLGGRPEKFRKKEIEMMKALAKNGTPIKDIAAMLETTRATV